MTTNLAANIAAEASTEAAFRTGRPLPQNLDDWPRLMSPDNLRPDPELPLTDEVVHQYQIYNKRVGPVVTHDVVQVKEAVRQAHFDNENASLAGQRCVIIDGKPMAGKTQAALGVAFQETREVWTQQQANNDTKTIPWIYTEVMAGSRGFGVLDGIHRFCGLPRGSRDTARDLLDRLRKLTPRLGVRGIIIDDAHGIAGSGRRDSEQFANTLKSVITGLPVTVVVIGAGLERLGVLDGPAGEQVRQRSNWIRAGNWPIPDGNPKTPWPRLLGNLRAMLALPHGPQQWDLHNDAAKYIAEQTDNRPGLAIEWLKSAANHAVAQDCALDLRALKTTRRKVNVDQNRGR